MDLPYKKRTWGNFSFFLFTGIVGTLGAPFYISHYGISPFMIALSLFYLTATGLSITMGYHRLFSHSTYKAHPLAQSFFLFFGAAAFEQSALKWSSQHRDHHQYLDTERDPYSVKQGFWHAHIGWLVNWKQPNHYLNVHDLQKNSMVMSQHKYYGLWALVAGVVVPMLFGALAGEALAAFIIAVCFRIAFVQHTTFCVNSVCHWMGNKTYDSESTARDHWLVAILTFGEGYHNFHHRFPSDYRNGIRWYHWDPSKWGITLLRTVGLAYDLHQTPYFRILHARLTADKQHTHNALSTSFGLNPAFTKIWEQIELKYGIVQKALVRFEIAAREYQSVTESKFKAAALTKLHQRRVFFKNRKRQWVAFTTKTRANFSMPLAFNSI